MQNLWTGAQTSGQSTLKAMSIRNCYVIIYVIPARKHYYEGQQREVNMFIRWLVTRARSSRLSAKHGYGTSYRFISLYFSYIVCPPHFLLKLVRSLLVHIVQLFFDKFLNLSIILFWMLVMRLSSFSYIMCPLSTFRTLFGLPKHTRLHTLLGRKVKAPDMTVVSQAVTDRSRR